MTCRLKLQTGRLKLKFIIIFSILRDELLIDFSYFSSWLGSLSKDQTEIGSNISLNLLRPLQSWQIHSYFSQEMSQLTPSVWKNGGGGRE